MNVPKCVLRRHCTDLAFSCLAGYRNGRVRRIPKKELAQKIILKLKDEVIVPDPGPVTPVNPGKPSNPSTPTPPTEPTTPELPFKDVAGGM